MSISCMLGLAACLSYHGKKIHVDDVMAAMDTCAMVQERRPNSVESLTNTADYIESKIKRRIEWPRQAPYGMRYAAVMRECVNLERAFNQKQLWDNLDKWPY